jgi:hypothetical protein
VINQQTIQNFALFRVRPLSTTPSLPSDQRIKKYAKCAVEKLVGVVHTVQKYVKATLTSQKKVKMDIIIHQTIVVIRDFYANLL